MDDRSQGIGVNSREAATAWIEKNCVIVRLYAAKVAPRPDMAEDIAQKAFVIALQNINSFDASHSFLLWIRGIVRNVARHEWKSLARHSKIERDNLAEYVEHLANNPSALENLENIEQRRQALKQCLDKLPAHGRKIVHLHYTMGVSCAEAALQTGTTLSAVKMALVRIRQALRQCAQARLAGGE